MALNPHLSSRSLPVVKQELRLATHVGIKTYNRTFRRMDAALYLAQIVVRLQGCASRDYEPEIAQVNEAISAELKRLAGQLRTRANWVEKKLKTVPAGSHPSQVKYTAPDTVDLTVRTPKGREYADLLARLETTAQQIDQAWYAGVIDDLEQLQSTNELWRGCSRTCHVAERLARGLASRVREDRGPSVPYADMLTRRTGSGPLLEVGDEPSEDAVQDVAMDMTAAEVQWLASSEQLAEAMGADDPTSDVAGADDPPSDVAGADDPPSDVADADKPRPRLRDVLTGSGARS